MEKSEKPWVLVADDDTSILKSIMTILDGMDCQTFVASSGTEAIQKIIELSNGLNVVVTDYQMPGATGVDVVRAVKALDRDIGVIFMSGQAREVVEESAKLAGADQWLTKPFNVKDFREAVQNCLAMPADV